MQKGILKFSGLLLITALIVSAFGLASPVHIAGAQDNPVITLDDATPSVDIVITPVNGAPGVVDAELDGVLARLRDSNNAEVASTADKRVTRLIISLATNAAPHTLHLERLPGLSTARVLVSSRATVPDTSVPAAPSPLTVLNSPEAGQVVAAPSTRVPVVTSAGADFLNVHLPAQNSALQITDNLGAVVVNLTGDTQISGIAVRLPPGQYSVAFVNRDLNTRSELALTLSPSPLAKMPTLIADASGPAVAATFCAATITVASAPVRSGPGSAYTVLGSASQNTTLLVGGVATGGGWLLVKNTGGSGWVAQSEVHLTGTCNRLASFSVPVRDAVAVAQPANPPPPPGGSGGGGDDHHEGGNDD